MKTKKIAIIIICIIAVTGLFKFIHYLTQFPDTIIRLSANGSSFLDEKKKSDETIQDYPYVAELQFHLPFDSPLISDEVVYAFTGSDKEYWKVSILRKTKEGFRVERGEYEGFVLEDPLDFGYAGYASITNPNGNFEATFINEIAYTSFLEELNSKKRWRGTYLHMRDHKEEKQ